jgi:hypothetical protein
MDVAVCVWLGGVDWLDLAQDRGMGRTVVNTVTNIGVL